VTKKDGKEPLWNATQRRTGKGNKVGPNLKTKAISKKTFSMGKEQKKTPEEEKKIANVLNVMRGGNGNGDVRGPVSHVKGKESLYMGDYGKRRRTICR